METYEEVLEDRILSYFDFIWKLVLERTPEETYGNTAAQDLTQQVVMEVWKAQPVAELLGAEYFKRAVETKIINKKINATQDYKIFNNLVAQKQVTMYTEVVDVEYDWEQKENLGKLRKKFTDTEWKIFVLVSEGYSSTEIGDKLGMHDASVRRILKKARAKV